ncbi:MAG: two-component regulator propeller domain-containing protein [Patescibacteria group bacterium]
MATFFQKSSELARTVVPKNSDVPDDVLKVQTCTYSTEWAVTNLHKEISERITNVTDILVSKSGMIFAAYTTENDQVFVASTSDDGEHWDSTPLPENSLKNIRALRELSDGRLLVGGTGTNEPILYESTDGGKTWDPIATNSQNGVVFPNVSVTSVWDIVELTNGEILIATDALTNDPLQNNPSLFILDEAGKISELAKFPGIGVLSIAVNVDGVIVVATEESSEHDDSSIAGQSHIFISEDDGKTWKEGGVPLGANRIYDLLFHTSGDLYAGTGISGEFLHSKDNGMTWEKMTHLPTIQIPFGEGGESMRSDEITRIYQILELCDGSMLVGTGNNGGKAFLTKDGGVHWQEAGDTGSNNVVWALAQESDGTIWVGTGSHGGDVFRAAP